MFKSTRMAFAAATVGVALLAPITAHAGNGSSIGAGLAGFGIGAIIGSALAPQTVYVAPPPPVYYAPPPPPVVYAPAPPVIVYGASYRYGYSRHWHGHH